jgi:N-acetylmuramoyl-L-alanine amidase
LILAPSPNADARPAGAEIDHLVLHYTGMQTATGAIARLRDPVAKVSSHYVVDEDGTVYALVGETLRAWHAGISFWRGARELNGRSIGIEIVNPGHEWGYRAFPAAQMLAVRDLCLKILARHPIPARNVVGHSDIAPNRKQDPGELFPWAWLAGQGVGLWTESTGPAGDLMADLAAIGYDTSLPPRDVITTFQRHFLPQHLTGVADEKTTGRAAALLNLLSRCPSYV